MSTRSPSPAPSIPFHMDLATMSFVLLEAIRTFPLDIPGSASPRPAGWRWALRQSLCAESPTRYHALDGELRACCLLGAPNRLGRILHDCASTCPCFLVPPVAFKPLSCIDFWLESGHCLSGSLLEPSLMCLPCRRTIHELLLLQDAIPPRPGDVWLLAMDKHETRNEPEIDREAIGREGHLETLFSSLIRPRCQQRNVNWLGNGDGNRQRSMGEN